MTQQPTNEEIATLLERIGQLLETNETNPYRVRAYFSAAATVRGEDKPVAELANDHAALISLAEHCETLPAFRAAALSDFEKMPRS